MLLLLIDVGINKPFKSNMKKLYTNFIMGQDTDVQIRGATRFEVSGWILEAVGQISEATTKNAWRKTGYSYYPYFGDVGGGGSCGGGGRGGGGDRIVWSGVGRGGTVTMTGGGDTWRW